MRLFALILTALLMGAVSVFAAEGDVGAAELALMERIFTGNLGLTIGLALCIGGIYKFFVKEDTSGGILLVVVGVFLTLLPGVYNGLRIIICPVAEALGGKCGGTGKG